MFLRYNDVEFVRFNDIRNLSYQEFEIHTNSHLREYVFSKWIKSSVEDDIKYIEAKNIVQLKPERIF